ncbi:Nuclear export mediator factor NEMF, partial [Balamuthia mandrillaris]
MKRFSSLDTHAMVCDLRSKVVGLRVANVYDLAPKTYLFKLALPDRKAFLLVESAIRVHTTQFQREHHNVPSVFALRLRKHIRTKRIEEVKQLGVDRVIDFTVGSGPAEHHLILELYSQGNIILTDKDYVILALLRPYKFEAGAAGGGDGGGAGETSYNIAPGHKYPVHLAHVLAPVGQEKLEQMLASVEEEKRSKMELRHLLNSKLDFGPTLVEHLILTAGLKPGLKISEWDPAFSEPLLCAIADATSLYDQPLKGYIILKTPKGQAANKKGAQSRAQKKKGNQQAKDEEQEEQAKEKDKETETENKEQGENKQAQETAPQQEQQQAFSVFVPFLYKQFEGQPFLEYDSFDRAVDTFFSQIEAQRIEEQRVAQEGVVIKKLDKVKEDQTRRIQSLKKAQLENVDKARLIEENLEDVEAAIMIMRTELSRGVDWNELWGIIKEARKNGDPIANIVHRLKLETNQVTLLLSHRLDEDVASASNKVDVDISLSAYANAQAYYSAKKKSEQKHQKTIDAAEHAMKAAEKKARASLNEVKIKASIQKIRKTYWFEKFYWFISSENYLIISGRDAQQNELIVKRYLRKGDAYVHADIHGASSCVVRNNDSDKPIPPLTLAQAGQMTVCRSAAWKAKVVTSAYWVHHHQVSKTAPSGEYLVTGSFMIRGKKNYLPPAPLVMGLGFLFKLDESSIPNHVNERRIRGQDKGNEDEETAQEESVEEEQDEDDEEANEQQETREEKKAGTEKPSANASKREGEKEAKESEEKDGDETEEKEDTNEQEEEGEHSSEGESDEEEGEPTPSAYRVKLMMDTPQTQEAKQTNKEEDVDDDDEEDEQETKQANSTNKARLNAAEKRRLKKLKKRGLNPDQIDLTKPQQQQQSNKAKKQQQQQQQQHKGEDKARQAPRGKKGKQKRIQRKYADQDEEERRIALELLASAGNPEKQREEREKLEKRQQALEHQRMKQQQRKERQRQLNQ